MGKLYRLIRMGSESIGKVQRYGIRFIFYDLFIKMDRIVGIYKYREKAGLRDYGELRNFIIDRDGGLFIDESYVDNILHAPDFEFRSPDDLSRLYGIAPSHIDDSIYLYRYTYSYKMMVRDALKLTHEEFEEIKARVGLDSAKVIALAVGITPHTPENQFLPFINRLLLLVEDEKTREILNKIVTVMVKLSKHISDNNIPLESILANLDLYYCIALGME